MFVEADGFVVISVKQPFAMQTGIVDQTRQMNVATKFLVGTARSQFLHEAIYVAGRGRARLIEPSGGSDTLGLSFGSNSVCCKARFPTTILPEKVPPFLTLIAFAVTLPSHFPFLRIVTIPSATTSPDIRPRISILPTRTRRKNCTSHRFSTTISEADNLPKILPEVLMTIVPAQSRFPRNRPSMRARRQRTLLLLRSPLVVTYTSPLVRMERLKLVVIL